MDAIRLIYLAPAAMGSLAFLSMAGCSKPAPPPVTPPPTVTVSKPVARKIVEHAAYTGRVAAIQDVEVRPRVTGYITEIPFQEGATVKKGDLLFVIDPRPYQASLDQANGQLEQAQAARSLAGTNYGRAQTLLKTEVSSKQEFDQAATNRNQSNAQVTAAQAAVDSAKLDLGFTQVRSPIDGRVSREQITLGNLVTSNTTVLTNIVSVDPVYAYADVDERTVISSQKFQNAGQGQSARDKPLPVAIALEGEQGYPHKGKIDFIDNRINAATGTLAIRGSFPNPDGALLPGMFIRMEFPTTGEIDALLVTDQAVGSDQGQKFVYVVRGGKAERQPVTLGPVADGLRVVREGLKADDEVVINGVVKVRADALVKTHEGRMEDFASDQMHNVAPAPAGTANSGK